MANQQQSKFDLRPLVEAIDTMKQKITLLTNDQRLGMSNVFCFSSGASHDFCMCSQKQANGPNGQAQPSGVNSAESGICETEQHEVLATQTKTIKGPEWELEQGQGGNGPGNSRIGNDGLLRRADNEKARRKVWWGTLFQV